MTKNKPQAPKGRNENLMRAMQEKRFGSAATPHKNKKAYNRKSKHGKGWE